MYPITPLTRHITPHCSASFQEQAAMLESQAKFEAERLSQQIFTISGEFLLPLFSFYRAMFTNGQVLSSIWKAL